jgi:hypothetical protein
MTAAALTPDEMLADDMGKFYADPLGFVMYAFEWDADESIRLVRLEEPYKSRYGREFGPDQWACELLDQIGESVKGHKFNGVRAVDPIQIAISSGHGIGKSTITAWLILWIASTRPYCKGVVTANTSDQLKTKTWGELGKWWKKCITGHWFHYNNGKGNMNLYQKDYPESWRVDAQTCREENSESFAGLHAANSTPFYLFDEASAVPDKIWEVAEGGLTDGEPMWFAFGNPTRNSGRFHACFNRLRHRWKCLKIDSRNVKITNKKKIQEWVDDYGEDSDFVKVRVRGEFPSASSLQFIPADIVQQAVKSDHSAILTDPLIMGVDVARFGDDQSVIRFRRGRDARTIKALKFRGIDTMQLASIVAQHAKGSPHTFGKRCDAVFIDGGGVGGGVVDRCRQLRVHNIIEVNFGGKSSDRKYANKRAQMWGMMRDWLAGGSIPDEPELVGDLIGVEYGFNVHNEIQLEKKEDMKRRGLASPDDADALALTFAYPVGQLGDYESKNSAGINQSVVEYDPYNLD